MTDLGQVPILGTTREPLTARNKTEQGSTAFAEGRSFRAYFSGELADGEVRTFEIETPIDIDVTSIALNVDAGEVEYQNQVIPTTVGGFVDLLPFFRLNSRTDVTEPAYTARTIIRTGGTISGGVEIDRAVVRTGTNNQRASIIEEAQSRRGASPGTYYISLVGGANNTKYTLYATWEE